MSKFQWAANELAHFSLRFSAFHIKTVTVQVADGHLSDAVGAWRRAQIQRAGRKLLPQSRAEESLRPPRRTLLFITGEHRQRLASRRQSVPLAGASSFPARVTRSICVQEDADLAEWQTSGLVVAIEPVAIVARSRDAGRSVRPPAFESDERFVTGARNVGGRAATRQTRRSRPEDGRCDVDRRVHVDSAGRPIIVKHRRSDGHACEPPRNESDPEATPWQRRGRSGRLRGFNGPAGVDASRDALPNA